MRKNTVKEALAEGKLQLGTGFGQLRSPEIPRILAGCLSPGKPFEMTPAARVRHFADAPENWE